MPLLYFPRTFSVAYTADFPALSAYPSLISSAVMRHLHREPFITKLVIGLIVGLVAHKIAKLSDEHDHAYVIRWSAIAAVCGLGFNCFFEPALKYVWYTLLFPNADKAASAIKALLAITTYTTIINAVINSVIAVVLYAALRPALKKAGFITAERA